MHAKQPDAGIIPASGCLCGDQITELSENQQQNIKIILIIMINNFWETDKTY